MIGKHINRVLRSTGMAYVHRHYPELCDDFRPLQTGPDEILCEGCGWCVAFEPNSPRVREQDVVFE